MTLRASIRIAGSRKRQYKGVRMRSWGPGAPPPTSTSLSTTASSPPQRRCYAPKSIQRWPPPPPPPPSPLTPYSSSSPDLFPAPRPSSPPSTSSSETVTACVEELILNESRLEGSLTDFGGLPSSPKYGDPMLSGWNDFSPRIDEWDEEGGINLWNFY
ncbi:unnamed protein product [Spirodela intermedia]|uniref:Uncharacterized protein n=1 Tax=Spirodela intermedia TaxID=51605 RepID=A0ABN7E7S2_SPIIN|nr:unnamed protein product [Spirodela intermedia]